MNFLHARLQKRKNQGLLRSLQCSSGLIDFTSNDYFGFARGIEATNSSAGATGSRLLTGHHLFYEELEEQIAAFHRAESCLIFNSGYTANLGLLSALGTSDATFIYDLEIHASMIDGIRLSEAARFPFRHNDLDSLEMRLKQGRLPVYVLAESIYSLSGDVAPLEKMTSLCEKYGAYLIVDEAHATGICGDQGEGRVAELGLESAVFARVVTFSKALGAHGACVLGSSTLKEYLINFSRPLIYTTALGISALEGIGLKYARLRKEVKSHQSRLERLNGYFSKKWSVAQRNSVIYPIYIPDVKMLRNLAQRAKEIGLDVRPIVPPTVAKGKECLRVVLHSFNREEEIDRLAEALL